MYGVIVGTKLNKSNWCEIIEMHINIRISKNFVPMRLEQLKSQVEVNAGGMWDFRSLHALLVGVWLECRLPLLSWIHILIPFDPATHYKIYIPMKILHRTIRRCLWGFSLQYYCGSGEWKAALSRRQLWETARSVYWENRAAIRRQDCGCMAAWAKLNRLHFFLFWILDDLA